MYHDEFARTPSKPVPHGEDLLPVLPLQVGGGLSLGLAASLNPPASMVIFYLGGLLPLVACSLSIAAHQLGEWLASLAPTVVLTRPSAVPIPHLAASGARAAKSRLKLRRTISAR